KSATLQKLSVETRGSMVTLRGIVNTHFEKQLARQCQERVPGIRKLIDEIEVRGGSEFVPADPLPRDIERELQQVRGQETRAQHGETRAQQKPERQQATRRFGA